MLHIEFITDLGARVTVDVESEGKLLDVQRQYGRLGWTSGDVPTGGYQFPLENEPDFDWSLIGARKWTNPEGEEMILHKGHAYRRRELEAVDSRKLKLPAAVKYSRGAKNADPDHVREKADGEFEYVTLAIFRGGRRQERYAVPGGAGAGRAPAQAAGASRPAPTRPQAANARTATVARVEDEETPF
ncbi:single-stranded DNA-binding protein [Deinococcus planocerae]|uniref:single-stranded DNA-binding protein n=1 Tax=Deinococcus planocerae TaxID=1737569 RepID=UPI000C7F10E5|nr:single-stranded DNA-binding protein [Deinococcus planocerae]